MRIEPPQSDAVTKGTIPEAIAAELPPDEPPGVRSRFQGFRVRPNNRFLVNAMWPNSGVLVLPTTIAPAALSRATWIESSFAILSLNGTEPYVVAIPATPSRSFTPSGRPASIPVSSRRAIFSSSARASAIASSGRNAQNALNLGLSASIRERLAATSSLGLSSRRRIMPARSNADIQCSSAIGEFPRLSPYYREPKMKNATHDALAEARRTRRAGAGTARCAVPAPAPDTQMARRRDSGTTARAGQQIAAELFPPQSVGNSGEVPPRYNL